MHACAIGWDSLGAALARMHACEWQRPGQLGTHWQVLNASRMRVRPAAKTWRPGGVLAHVRNGFAVRQPVTMRHAPAGQEHVYGHAALTLRALFSCHGAEALAIKNEHACMLAGMACLLHFTIPPPLPVLQGAAADAGLRP